MASDIGNTNIFPSPIWPVFAAVLVPVPPLKFIPSMVRVSVAGVQAGTAVTVAALPRHTETGAMVTDNGEILTVSIAGDEVTLPHVPVTTHSYT